MEADDENERIRQFVNTPALDWQLGIDGDSSGGVGRGKVAVKGRRSYGGRPITTPPEGYICRRCQVAGHFIQHCPTNGDPAYDIKVLKPARGIPKSMLVANAEGSYLLPSGETAVMKPNEGDFEKEMEGVPSKKTSWSVDDVPPELLCPLCKKLMKDAVLASRCCFRSFCDKCIRDLLINSKLKCHCGETKMLADFLIPNKTLRRAIDRILECGSSTSSSGSSGRDSKTISFQVQDLGSALHCPAAPSKVKSSNSSSEKDHKPTSPVVVQDRANTMTQAMKVVRAAESAGISEVAIEPMNVKKKTVSQENVQVAGEMLAQKKLIAGELGKKKRKRNSAQDSEACDSSRMMPASSREYNSYWTDMWAYREGYEVPCSTAAMDDYYGFGHFGLPYGALMTQETCGSQ